MSKRDVAGRGADETRAEICDLGACTVKCITSQVGSGGAAGDSTLARAHCVF